MCSIFTKKNISNLYIFDFLIRSISKSNNSTLHKATTITIVAGVGASAGRLWIWNKTNYS